MSQASDLGVVRAWGAPSMPDWLRRCYSGGLNAQSPVAVLSRTSRDGTDESPMAEEARFSFRDAGYPSLADFDGSLK